MMALPASSVRLAVRLVIVLAAAGLVLVSASAAGGGRSGYDSSQLIAFTRADGIYAMRADGTGVRLLRRGGATVGAFGLAWSSDGRRLAFSNGRAIWTIRADGTGLVSLLTATQISASGVGEPSWAPLGGRIALTAVRPEQQGDIWMVNADGTNAHRLQRTPNRSEYQLDWSPYGNRIAFTDVNGYFLHLYVMDTSGKHVRALNPGWLFQAGMAHWRPQGNQLAFMGWASPTFGSDSDSGTLRDADIWVTDTRGRASQRLTHDTVVDSSPAWSFDGSKIVFVRGGNPDWVFVPPQKRSTAEIYVMNADGTGITRLTHNKVGEGSPAWQPIPTS